MNSMLHPSVFWISNLLLVALALHLALKGLRAWQQPVRSLGVAAHAQKHGTPTFGGVLILGGVFLSTGAAGLWGEASGVGGILSVGVLMGVIGGLDDLLKVRRAHHQGGLSGRWRLLVQAAGIACFAGAVAATQPSIPCPGGGELTVPLVGFAAWVILVVVGSANAVNLSDGMDGLATVMCAITSAALAWLAWHAVPEHTLLPHTQACHHVALLLLGISGSCLGFWWHNAHPARIFMGDVGALPLGGMLGAAAVLLRMEWLWALMGAVFVLETLSVMLQVLSFKTTGRRVFKMAPLHHHFEHQGLHETTITARLWLVTAVCAALAVGVAA